MPPPTAQAMVNLDLDDDGWQLARHIIYSPFLPTLPTLVSPEVSAPVLPEPLEPVVPEPASSYAPEPGGSLEELVPDWWAPPQLRHSTEAQNSPIQVPSDEDDCVIIN